MARRTCIAVGGENLIDHVTRDGVVSACPGGSPFNVALALGRQGADVCYLSPISTDDWGELLASTLVESGVALAGGRNTRPTTMARVTVSAGLPSYRFERDGTAERQVTRAALESSLPETAGAIATGSLTLTGGTDADAWEAFCKSCHAAGRLVALDPNVRLSVVAEVDGYRKRILRMCAHASLLKLSDEDLAALFPDSTPDRAIATLRGLSPARVVILTRGAEGVSAWMDDTRVDLPAAPLPHLVDTVGAGDTFTAAVLAGLADRDALSPGGLDALTRDDLTYLLRRAAVAAALNCGRAGCNPPSRDDLDAALHRKV